MDYQMHEATIDAMTADLFLYWFDGHWTELFRWNTGAWRIYDTRTPADSEERRKALESMYRSESAVLFREQRRTTFEAMFDLRAGRTGEALGFIFLAQRKTDSVSVRFTEFADGLFVGRLSKWLEGMFGVVAAPIAASQQPLPRLSEGEHDELAKVRGWKSSGLRQDEYAHAVGTSERNLRRWKDKYSALGYDTNWPD